MAPELADGLGDGAGAFVVMSAVFAAALSGCELQAKASAMAQEDVTSPRGDRVEFIRAFSCGARQPVATSRETLQHEPRQATVSPLNRRSRGSVCSAQAVPDRPGFGASRLGDSSISCWRDDSCR
jgi:hypothetical protein